MSYSLDFLAKCNEVIKALDAAQIEGVVELLAQIKQRDGRLFLVGSGGGAGHSSHAVCDFRKLCQIEAYAPYDNVTELTARTNDDGWETTLENWLIGSRLRADDCLFVFSVGGGNEEAKISLNLVRAVKYAKSRGAKVVGIVGRNGGYTKVHADAVVLIPTIDEYSITPLVEGFQAVLWHLMVTHPKLCAKEKAFGRTRQT